MVSPLPTVEPLRVVEECQSESIVECQCSNDGISADTVDYYTGMTLSVVVDLASSGISSRSSSTLAHEQEILLVLMKLSLCLDHRDLACRFGISCGSVSNIFHKWKSVMAERLKFLIKWPSRDKLRKTMPTQFRNLGQVFNGTMWNFREFVAWRSNLG